MSKFKAFFQKELASLKRDRLKCIALVIAVLGILLLIGGILGVTNPNLSRALSYDRYLRTKYSATKRTAVFGSLTLFREFRDGVRQIPIALDSFRDFLTSHTLVLFIAGILATVWGLRVYSYRNIGISTEA